VSVSSGDQQRIRQRVNGWRAAEKKASVARRREGPLAPDASLAAAEELRELVAPIYVSRDTTRERQVAEARAAWNEVRARWHGRT
jgi:hypothetical protein